MKKTALFVLLLLVCSTFANLANATSPQQPVPEEKKRAMHKLDPIDIFPQVQERGGRDRNRDKRASTNDASTVAANESGNSESGQNSKRSSRKKNSSSEPATNDLAATALPTPAPVSETASTATNLVTPQSQATPVVIAESQPSLAEKANSTSASSQTLAAMNTSPLPGNGATAKNSALPLPIILALLVLVLVMLILVFTKLIRYLRNPIS